MEETAPNLAAEIARLKAELATRDEHIAYLEKKVGIDELTGAPNRFTFDRVLAESLKRVRGEVEEHRQSGKLTELSLIMLDLDHFKQVNDTYGHPVGDLVLRRVAACLMQSVRDEDLVARMGGEEFMVLLRGAGEGAALRSAEHLRQELEKMEFPEQEGLRVSGSFGVAGSQHSTESAELVRMADEALYKAKERGRNCVVPYEG